MFQRREHRWRIHSSNRRLARWTTTLLCTALFLQAGCAQYEEVAFTVLNNDGRPAGDAWVSVHPIGPQLRLPFQYVPAWVGGITDADGNVVLPVDTQWEWPSELFVSAGGRDGWHYSLVLQSLERSRGFTSFMTSDSWITISHAGEDPLPEFKGVLMRLDSPISRDKPIHVTLIMPPASATAHGSGPVTRYYREPNQEAADNEARIRIMHSLGKTP
ncbi:MAG: hypothetical protein BIFFINMI_03949 [Phycisphaerae bacterium]|nr:hypothetical protein [Phycisphaerae bacterium]